MFKLTFRRPLTSPNGFSVSLSADSTTSQLSWQAVAGAERYDIERSSLHKNGSRYVGQTLLTSNTNSLDDTAGAGTYSYRVRAIRSAEVGPWSNIVEGITLVSSGGSSDGGTGGDTKGGGKGGGKGKR